MGSAGVSEHSVNTSTAFQSVTIDPCPAISTDPKAIARFSEWRSPQLTVVDASFEELPDSVGVGSLPALATSGKEIALSTKNDRKITFISISKLEFFNYVQ
jgi:hypothetical protein